MLRRLGRSDAAVATLREGLDLLGGAVAIRLALVGILRDQHRPEDALEAARPVLDLPRPPASWLRLAADLHEEMGSTGRATELRARAAELEARRAAARAGRVAYGMHARRTLPSGSAQRNPSGQPSVSAQDR